MDILDHKVDILYFVIKTLEVVILRVGSIILT